MARPVSEELRTLVEAGALSLVRSLEQIDFEFQPWIDRKALRELAGLSFVEQAQNVGTLGLPGVGKTHLAITLGVKAVEAGYSMLFPTFEALVTRSCLRVTRTASTFHRGGSGFPGHRS